MALGDAYATMAELKGYADHMSDSVDDTQITEVLLQASRAIEKECHRQFNDAGSATARIFYPDNDRFATVDDFISLTSVKTDPGNTGTYSETWATTDYQSEPLNGVVDGEIGWPFWQLRAVFNRRFPCVYYDQRAPLQVTAQWGWSAVPKNVKVACIYLALETLKLKGAPFGVANFDQFGPVRVRDNPKILKMLQPYILNPVMVG